MDSTTAAVINIRDILIRDKLYKVREMKWPDAVRFMQATAALLRDVVTMELGEDGKTKVGMNFGVFTDKVMASADLCRLLVESACDYPKDQLDDLSVIEFSDLLLLCIEVNLSPAVLGNFQKVGSAVVAAFTAKQTPAT